MGCACKGRAEGRHDLICEDILTEAFGSVANAPADVQALLRERGRLPDAHPTMTVRGIDVHGDPFTVQAPFMAVKPTELMVVDGYCHEVVVIDTDGVVYLGRAYL